MKKLLRCNKCDEALRISDRHGNHGWIEYTYTDEEYVYKMKYHYYICPLCSCKILTKDTLILYEKTNQKGETIEKFESRDW